MRENPGAQAACGTPGGAAKRKVKKPGLKPHLRPEENGRRAAQTPTLRFAQREPALQDSCGG